MISLQCYPTHHSASSAAKKKSAASPKKSSSRNLTSNKSASSIGKNPGEKKKVSKPDKSDTLTVCETTSDTDNTDSDNQVIEALTNQNLPPPAEGTSSDEARGEVFVNDVDKDTLIMSPEGGYEGGRLDHVTDTRDSGIKDEEEEEKGYCSNPSNAKATFVQSTTMQRFSKNI